MGDLLIQPIILCGGSGSRLWPLSRESFPKQYLNLINNSKNSLLQETYARLKVLKNIEPPILICNEQHRFLVAEQMREIRVMPKSIILEPIGKNTAAAVAVGAIRSNLHKKDSVLLVLAADHIIKDSKEFIKAVESGYELANLGRLVTFGIVPDSPNTGYGYIESYEALSKENKASSILRFIEKPNIDLAKKLILDKRFSWNSGMFMFKTSTIIEEYKKISPEIIKLCSDSLDKAEKDLDFLRLNKKYFLKCPDISFDKAIMEKSSLGSVIKLDAGWSDIGNWQSLWENEKKDLNGNVIIGKVVEKDTNNCYVRSESRVIACLGLNELIIIENGDSILIAKKSLSQDVKAIVKKLDKEGFIAGKLHQKVYRPWGNYTSIADDERWQVKRIEVKSKSSLSLQMHHHRSEHWIIVKGTALVEIDDKEELFSENESVYIPLGSKHRLSNPGKLKLILIEVQSGSYLGEDDIFRFKDNYGRG